MNTVLWFPSNEPFSDELVELTDDEEACLDEAFHQVWDDNYGPFDELMGPRPIPLEEDDIEYLRALYCLD